MKFSDNPAKSSLPGRPVLWVSHAGKPSVVAQADEPVAQGYAPMTGGIAPASIQQASSGLVFSAETQQLISDLESRRL